jgi:hypothetical protein
MRWKRGSGLTIRCCTAQEVVREIISAQWSLHTAAMMMNSAVQQSIITEPVCRFFELLQYSECPKDTVPLE